MGVKFSELHEMPTQEVAVDDYLAILDTSAGTLKRTQAYHASEGEAFGKGSPTMFGHLKISDSYVTEVGGAEDGIAASQLCVYNTYNKILNDCLPSWVGTWEEWEQMTDEEKNYFVIINITDR